MASERDISNCSSDDNNGSSPSDLLVSMSSGFSRNTLGKNVFTVIDPNISSDAEIEVLMDIWMNIFEENPKTGIFKLFAAVINCFDIDVCDTELNNLNSSLIVAHIIKHFKTMAKAGGSWLTSKTIKESSDIQKTLELFASIFRRHNSLFFLNDTHKDYFIFLRDVLIKIAQSDFAGPRRLATCFGLKIITGLVQSNNFKLVDNDFNLLLDEFLVKRWKDISCTVREIVLLELKLWIQIDSVYFLDNFWIYIYWAIGDQSSTIQIAALKISKIILDVYSDVPTVKLLVKKILTVLANLLLSTNEDVVISAFNLYSTLPSINEEDDEEHGMSNIESIALELIFSEKSNIAQLAAKFFVDKIVNSKPNEAEKLKVILIFLRGVPSQIKSISIAFFVDVIYNLCPVLTNFKLISQMLSLENYIETNDKYILMNLLMHVVKWSITGNKPEQKLAITGDQNDTMQLHTNKYKKKEFTTYILLHLLKELEECQEPTHAFSVWTLIQFTDFNLVQNKMIIPEILKHIISFYSTWNTPTILETISKCINIMISDIEGYEQDLCLKCIKDIAQKNINILIAGVESTPTPSLLIQKSALIKMWSLAKYNHIPDELEPLKCLSYYVPNFNTTQTNLIASNFALTAYMEVLRKQLFKAPTSIQNEDSIEQCSIEDTFNAFIDSMFNILSKYDKQLINICETAFWIVDDLLRIKSNRSETNYELNKNQDMMLTNFVFCTLKNSEHNDDLNTLKLVEVYIRLIQDGLIEMNHLITLLQFVKMELLEPAVQKLFNFFCNKENGNKLSQIINVYFVYLFENIISQKSDFENSTIKDAISVGIIITRLLNKCTDQVGKRLISTNIHRNGIQYAMSDTFSNPHCDYPFKQFFWVLASMCDILTPYDARRLADYLFKKPTTQELINSDNEHILNYVYELQKLCEAAEKN